MTRANESVTWIPSNQIVDAQSNLYESNLAIRIGRIGLKSDHECLCLLLIYQFSVADMLVLRPEKPKH